MGWCCSPGRCRAWGGPPPASLGILRHKLFSSSQGLCWRSHRARRGRRRTWRCPGMGCSKFSERNGQDLMVGVGGVLARLKPRVSKYLLLSIKLCWKDVCYWKCGDTTCYRRACCPITKMGNFDDKSRPGWRKMISRTILLWPAGAGQRVCCPI